MDRFRVFAAEDEDGRLLGYAAVSDAGALHSLFVHRDFQGCGIAARLLAEAEAYASAAGVLRITSEVSLTARPFFERRGYRTVARQRRKAFRLSLVNFRMEKDL